MSAAGDIYEGHYEGWYCVSCEAFKQEKDLVDGTCPIHRTKPDWIREKNYFFRLSKYRDRCSSTSRRIRSFLEPDVRRNEILRLIEGGLEDISVSRAGQSWGIPMPDDPASVDLRLVRRADQLLVGGRLRHGSGAVEHVVAGRPARDRQGHHAVPRGDLAGDADERRSAGAAPGLRPRLGELQGREDEQVARHGGRAARSGAADSARNRCACTWSRRSRSGAIFSLFCVAEVRDK